MVTCLCTFQNETAIFPPTTGGAEKMAADMNIPFLGKLPLDPRIGEKKIVSFIELYNLGIVL